MSNLAEQIAKDLSLPKGKDLQKCILEAMFLFERFAGIDAGDSMICPSAQDADISEQSILRLSESMRGFIRENPGHSDVGSAIWSLGKLREEEDVALFRDILDPDKGYDSWSRDQARCALQNLGYESF